MLNLNYMHINEDYEFPSDLHDSQELDLAEDDLHQNIRVEQEYELPSQHDSDADEGNSKGYRSIEIDHSLDDSSIQHDTFLEMIHKQQKQNKMKPYQPVRNIANQPYLMVDKTRVSFTLMKTQNIEETICFRNPTASSMKIKFNECPFEIQSQKTLAYVLADCLQIILQPWERIELNFLIKQNIEQFGDIIENVIVTAEFLGRNESISPVEIHFNIHFVTPHLKFHFQGKSQAISLLQGRISVAKLKANNFGEYCLNIGLAEGPKQMELLIETRGKMTPSSQRITLRERQSCNIKLRLRGYRSSTPSKQKNILILRPVNTKLCYVLGVQFLS